MRVRLAFAVAAHLDPEIFIVDEVLSVGDHAFQAKCLERMKSVAANDGQTVLYVSHQMVTVEHLCPRSLLIADGRLVFDGPTEETLAQYLRLFPRGEATGTPGVFDLASADRSNGGYEPLLQRLELRPGGGSPADNVRMGERLRMEISVAGLNDIIHPWVLVSIGSSKVPVLIRMNSRAVPLNSAQDRRDRELIVVDIPALPLTPGDYRIEVQIKDRSRTVDFVGPAGEFRVDPADVFGGGYRFDSGGGFFDGYFVVPWERELRPAPEPFAEMPPLASTRKSDARNATYAEGWSGCPANLAFPPRSDYRNAFVFCRPQPFSIDHWSRLRLLTVREILERLSVLNTAVVLLIFNRPTQTRRMLEAIAQAKPKRLFIIADGPRSPEEDRALCGDSCHNEGREMGVRGIREITPTRTWAAEKVRQRIRLGLLPGRRGDLP